MAHPAVRLLVGLLLVPWMYAAAGDPPPDPDTPAIEPASPESANPAGDADLVPSLPQIILSSQVVPDYPPAALAGRFTGTVLVRVTILSDGSVQDATVVECNHPNLGFEDASLAAVRRWKFEPAVLEGQPIPYVMTYRLNFRTEGTGRNRRAFVSASAGPAPNTTPSQRLEPTAREPVRPEPTSGLGSRK